MWKFIGVNVEGVIGVPATDLTDEEFNFYSGKIGAQFIGQPNALANCGLWTHEDDNPMPVSSKAPKITVEETKVDEGEVTDGNG